jgi:hypothetical protein
MLLVPGVQTKNVMHMHYYILLMPCCLRNPFSLPDMILFVCHAQTIMYGISFSISSHHFFGCNFLESALNSNVTEGLIKCSYIFYTMCSARM